MRFITEKENGLVDELVRELTTSRKPIPYFLQTEMPPLAFQIAFSTDSKCSTEQHLVLCASMN